MNIITKFPKHTKKATKKLFLINSLLFTLTGILAEPVSTRAIEETSAANIEILRSNDKISQNTATKVRLLEAGSYPREILRFQPIPQTKEIATMTVDMDANFSVNGQSIPQINIPKMKMDIATQVTKVDSNGDIHAEAVYTNIAVIPDSNNNQEAIEQMRSYFESIEGFKVTFVSDDRGNYKEINYNFPENLEPTLNSFKDISAPLPSEPVGIGARWQIINNIPGQSGINIRQILIYELIDRKYNLITLAVNLVLNKDSPAINWPEIPSTMKIEVISFDGSGRGTMQIDLNQILPINYFSERNSGYKVKIKNVNISEEQIVETKSKIIMNLQSER